MRLINFINILHQIFIGRTDTHKDLQPMHININNSLKNMAWVFYEAVRETNLWQPETRMVNRQCRLINPEILLQSMYKHIMPTAFIQPLAICHSISKSKLALSASPCSIIYPVCGSSSRHSFLIWKWKTPHLKMAAKTRLKQNLLFLFVI